MTQMSTTGIAARLWTWAGVLRVLKHVVPLPALVRLVHTGSVGPRSADLERRLEGYMAASGAFPRRAPGNCLERSLAAYRILCRASASPTLVVGFRHSAAQSVEGHVWVVVDGRALAERPDSVATYQPALAFGPDGRQRSSDGSSRLPTGIRFA
jgi:hypothetical protein